MDMAEADHSDRVAQHLAMKAHLEARQQEDLRKDIAACLHPTAGPFSKGDTVYYWNQDPSKIKRGQKHGTWIKARIVNQEGAMCAIDTGKTILKVNQSKLRKNYEFDAPDPVLSVWQVESQDSLDFLELYSTSSSLSAACAANGLRVAPPVDLRKDLQPGSESQSRTVRALQEQAPMVVHVEPPSRVWTTDPTQPGKHPIWTERKLSLIHI